MLTFKDLLSGQTSSRLSQLQFPLVFLIHKLVVQGFPKKRRPILKNEKNMPDLLSDDREGKIIEISTLNYLSNRASFWGNPVLAKIATSKLP